MNKTRRQMLGAAGVAIFSANVPSTALAQGAPLKIGMSMPQTGALGAGGQAALLALRMWVDDVNAKGGLLGRKVELIAYDDQSNGANTPGIYTKLLDVDKAELLIAPYGTNPTAPIMPLVKERGLMLMGNFSFQVNAKVQHDMWFNNAPWNDARGWSEGFLELGKMAGAKSIAIFAADAEFSQIPGQWRSRNRQKNRLERCLRSKLPAQQHRLLVHHPSCARCPSRGCVRGLLPQ